MNQNVSSLRGTAEQTLRSIIQKNFHIQHSNYQLEILPATGDNENFLGNLFRIKVKTNEQTPVIIVKFSYGGFLHDFYPTNEIYARELFIYERVLPTFHHFIEKNNCNFQLDFHPKFYGGCAINNDEYIILSDEKPKSFAPRYYPNFLSKQENEVVIDYLAKFHALSFALKHHNPDSYRELAKKLPFIDLNSTDQDDGSCRDYVEFLVDEAICALNDDDVRERERLLKFKGKMWDVMKMIRRIDDEDEYTVIIHGDFWLNNILFKYQDDKLENLCFVDFQLTFVCTPTFDLLSYIYLSTNPNQVSEMCHHYTEYYHKQLTWHLNTLGTNVDQVYPKSEFNRAIKKYADVSLWFKLFGAQMLDREPADMPDFAGSTTRRQLYDCMKEKSKESRRIYHKNMRPIILHLVENDLI